VRPCGWPRRHVGDRSLPRRLRQRATDSLTLDFFQREYLDAGKDLRTLEAETGIHRKLLARHARHLGVRLDPQRRGTPIDRDWLRTQTDALRRTNGDIGAELGVTGETIRRYRKQLGITAGRSGVHRLQLQRHPDLPDDIRHAVEGQRHGWRRLRRFQQTMTYPSINTAAQALGHHTSNLNLQIQRLETDIGAALIHRSGHHHQPMTPSQRGHQLLKLLDQPDVRHPLDQYANRHWQENRQQHRRAPGT
jgi:Bacterial regulatory helix-turn-helix protein, lysR family